MDIDRIVERLRAALRDGPPLRLAVLFGSGARGALRGDSDLDVGIVPTDAELPLVDELDLQVRLTSALGRHVDLVRLDRATTLLRYQVACAHVPIVADPPHELSRFIAQAGIEHADLRVLRDPVAERFRQRLAQERPATRGRS
ncbi:MAG: nucleotidyltransferase domain-containing protein [Deltaproteobacteria bacterium]|nr:nucleotidyltransferase domain-containing protein [Deltaproteobacteria bacterium]